MKTFRISILFSCLLLLFADILLSCSQEKRQSTKALGESIVHSTALIDNYTKQELTSLNDKANDPAIREIGLIWIEKAQKIKDLTEDFNAKQDSCFKVLASDNLSVTKSYLKDQIIFLTHSILQIDPKVNASLSKDFQDIIGENPFAEFVTINSKDNFQNHVLNLVSIIKNRSISFCNLSANPGCILKLEEFSVLIGQNSLHFKTGDFLELSAGVGAFSSASNPKFTIDNKNIQPNENSCAEYKIKVLGNPGKYSIPIRIDYYSEDGIRKSVNKFVDYYIDQ